MFNLIRAEFYRLRHSGLYALIMFLCTLGLVLIFPFTVNKPKFMDASLAVSVYFMSQAFLILIFMGAFTVMGVYIGTSYNNRMAYYEIMNGYSPFKIILAKCFSVGLAGAVIVYIPVAAILGFSAVKNGTGIIEQPLILFVLLFVMVLHASLVTLLYSMACKNLVFASVLAYVRFGIIDMVPALVITQEFKKLAKYDALNLSISSQAMNLHSATYDTKYILYVVLTCVVECAFAFGLVYYTYRNKKFK